MDQYSRGIAQIFGKNMHFEDGIFKIKAIYSLGYSFLKQGFPALRPLRVAEVRFVLVVSCEAGVRVA